MPISKEILFLGLLYTPPSRAKFACVKEALRSTLSERRQLINGKDLKELLNVFASQSLRVLVSLLLAW